GAAAHVRGRRAGRLAAPVARGSRVPRQVSGRGGGVRRQHNRVAWGVFRAGVRASTAALVVDRRRGAVLPVLPPAVAPADPLPAAAADSGPTVAGTVFAAPLHLGITHAPGRELFCRAHARLGALARSAAADGRRGAPAPATCQRTVGRLRPGGPRYLRPPVRPGHRPVPRR